MSSVVIWRDEKTGVYAEWNKQGPYSVFVPLFECAGVSHGDRTEYASRASAISAAKRKAKEKLATMNIVYVARMESRNFTFSAAAFTEEAARAALEASLRIHTKQYELDDDWFTPDDIGVLPMRVGVGYRDSSEITKP